MTALLQTSNLGKTFSSAGWGGLAIPWMSQQQTHAVRDVTLAINRGEILGLVGESGSGKSTFARCVLRLLEPSQGQIVFDGRDITHINARELRPLRSQMQMVFQSPDASLNPRMRVGNIVSDPVKLHLGLTGSAARKRVVELFERVGLSALDVQKYSHQLSGGQQQRVGVARALASNPQLLVLDEPTSALDASVRGQILNLLRDLRNDLEMTYLFISHDLTTIHYICDRAAVMYQGQIVEMGHVEEIFTNPRHPYTRMLVEAIPDLATAKMRRQSNISAKWDTVDHSQALAGACPFLPRCPISRAKCQDAPPLLEGEDGRLTRCWAIAEPGWTYDDHEGS